MHIYNSNTLSICISSGADALARCTRSHLRFSSSVATQAFSPDGGGPLGGGGGGGGGGGRDGDCCQRPSPSASHVDVAMAMGAGARPSPPGANPKPLPRRFGAAVFRAGILVESWEPCFRGLTDSTISSEGPL